MDFSNPTGADVEGGGGGHGPDYFSATASGRSDPGARGGGHVGHHDLEDLRFQIPDVASAPDLLAGVGQRGVAGFQLLAGVERRAREGRAVLTVGTAHAGSEAGLLRE